jgi:hypothetical protein
MATAGADGASAAAALFYAADQQLNLYFLSEEHTEHVRNLMARPLVSATVQEDGQDWRSICGIQLRGIAGPVSRTDWPRAAAIYVRRFSFLESILTGAESPGALLGPLARAKFYVLRPTWIRLIDNRVRFGHKDELWLGAPHGDS